MTIERVQQAKSKFKDYYTKDVEAFNYQIESIIKFGDIQEKRLFLTPENESEENIAETEVQNKQRIADYFKIMKNLDKYFANSLTYKFKYLSANEKANEGVKEG